ncbi:hypothetical protein HYC85_028746 [Camellia sinensis]|uniref:F-box domain-containing protein n=1 Tax=Camellia sinensis TaxID=4442 RepID=A0A7J7FW42_CAMSI|nr:hypothetical protein HYC85_028746 [Camellia sinensis]
MFKQFRSNYGADVEDHSKVIIMDENLTDQHNLSELENTTMDAMMRDWTNLPRELLSLVLSHLFLYDIKRFRNVYKTWQSVPSQQVVPSLIHCPIAESHWLDCNLGVFNPKEEDSSWTVLDGPKKPRGCDSVYESYLMECDGKLLSVFVGNKGRGVSVYTLDESEMAWQRVTDLGSKMLFVSHSTSFSSTKVVEGMENKIYFPRFCGKDGIFYCLATNRHDIVCTVHLRLVQPDEPDKYCILRVRRATIDTPFLIVLKTWTSPLEHSVIIHVCVRLEFPEVSATRLTSGSLDSTVLCLLEEPAGSPLVKRVYEDSNKGAGDDYLITSGNWEFAPDEDLHLYLLPGSIFIKGNALPQPPKNFRQSFVPNKDLKKLLDLPVQRRKAPLFLNFIPTYKSALPNVPKRKKKKSSPPPSATTLPAASTSRTDQGSTSDPADQPSS